MAILRRRTWCLKQLHTVPYGCASLGLALICKTLVKAALRRKRLLREL